jgi:hypothetical protein
LYSTDRAGHAVERHCERINAYLAPSENIIVEKVSRPLAGQSVMTFGNTPIDGGHLLLTRSEKAALHLTTEQSNRFVRTILGSSELIRGAVRYCLWIEDDHLPEAVAIPAVADRIRAVRSVRLNGGATARDIADRPHQFQRALAAESHTIVVPSVSSESRPYLPVGLVGRLTVVSNLAFALYDAPLWNMALVASRIHLVWIATVCGKLKTDFRYSNTLGWHTFPVPALTEQNRADLTRCAEDILLAREAHYPATIADLYDLETMPPNLREAHERNDEVLERIYIGKRFRNDTERLEKLFAMYTQMTAAEKRIGALRSKRS